MKPYYIGLDIGTNSVGWAVANMDYTIPKYRGNAMWGIRLFEESDTAEERRTFRAGRRRTERRKERLKLLEILFDKEISSIDPAFFRRLRESNLYMQDKTEEVPYALFADRLYTDKEFHKEFPSIYHLRKSILENKKKYDVRIVFLALHHIIKNRGHFLFENLTIGEISSFEKVFYELVGYLADNYDLELHCTDEKELSDVLLNKLLGKKKKTDAILQLCEIKKKTNPQMAAILSLMAGSSVKLADIFQEDTWNDTEYKSISFSDKFEEKAIELQNLLGEKFELLEKLKAIYDWAVLADILQGEQYISYAKVKTYETHQADLRWLKKFVALHCLEKKSEIFRKSKSGLNNYVAYAGKVKKNGKTGVLENRCTQEDFCGYLKKILPVSDNPEDQKMRERIENGTFMPKQITKDNGVIPMQIHRAELVAILKNAEAYLPFLQEKDEEGMTVSEKIIAIFDYRIPYYVGPLNQHSDKAWIVRQTGKIYPWNFHQKVDIEASAEAFIQNLTSKCTYLPQEDVLPKQSILYSRYMVLNELNNLKINGEKISVACKQDIFNTLFLTRKKVTRKMLADYFKANGIQAETITGFDGDFKANMKSYLDLEPFELTLEEKEDVIAAITIFGDDRRLLQKRLTAKYGEKLDTDEIRSISRLKYTGWGALSKAFLTDVESVDPESGEIFNIITALWETNDNLMMLLGSKYGFDKCLKEMTVSEESQSMREMVENLYVSPKIKRPIYQAMQIVQELVKIQGDAPKKIFVEVTRGPQEKKRTDSRRNKLLALYESCKNDEKELYEALQKTYTSDEDFRRDALYLYFTQMGKCMYTGDDIPLEQLFDRNVYDIDHIFPQSKVKDDSLDNRVLVKKEVNAKKDNIYPIPKDVRTKQMGFWHILLEKGLISKKKFERLTRPYPLTDEELSDFIQRQVVETGQSVKAVATLLRQIYERFGTEIVYVKAGQVSDFRHEYDMLKCREVNDFHHAKDAYLNIVVGNVYNEKFTHNRANFIKGLQTSKYSLNRMFQYNINNAWVADNDTSIGIVKKTMAKNNIRYTRYAFCQKGGLFDQNPLKKGKGQVSLKKGARGDTEKYGAYNRPSSTFFALVEYEEKKGKAGRKLVPVDLYLLREYEEDPVAYMKKYAELKNPRIVIPCIKYGACLSFDGFRAHISSKISGGRQIGFKPGVQLILSYHQEVYIKRLLKVIEKHKEPNSFDKITLEENLNLYHSLCEKMVYTIFGKKFAPLGEKLMKNQEKFKKLTLLQQGYVIAEILKILHANVMTGDLRLVGESGQTGATTYGANLLGIKGVSSICLIHQSVTGLYEKEIDLLH